jgi:hypothetical protein
MKSRGFTPLFEKDDCMDAGGRAMQERLPRGRGRFIKQIPLDPLFSKGEVLLTKPLDLEANDSCALRVFTLFTPIEGE